LFSVSPVAVDGVVLIDQNKALAGSVTPGDLPGFPISIKQPGSYRLAGNLTLPDANTSGIEINVQNVTLDLNGFATLGSVTCGELPTISCSTSGTGRGVRSSAFANVLIRNGFAQGMGGDGMFVLGGTVESIQATQNAGTGINMTAGIVRASITRDNGSAGIALGYGSVLRNALNHNRVGLSATNGTSYTGNTFNFNTVIVQGPGINTGQNLCDSAICPGAPYEEPDSEVVI
jgi:hypothetical protein